MIKPNTSSDVSSIDFKDPMSGLVIPRNDVPDFINIYFANIAQNTSDPTKVKLPTLQNDHKHNFDFLPPTMDDLSEMVKGIRSDMSTCVYGINMNICKNLLQIIPDKFLLLYANSMFYGNFPVKWNVSTVTLLPKSGDKTHPGNWRPISNTCIFSKVLEKLVHKQLSRYIMVHGLISPHQYGFVPGRSTHEAVFNVVKHIVVLIITNILEFYF